MKLTPGNYGKETTFEVRNFDVAIAVEEYAELGKHPALFGPRQPAQRL